MLSPWVESANVGSVQGPPRTTPSRAFWDRVLTLRAATACLLFLTGSAAEPRLAKNEKVRIQTRFRAIPAEYDIHELRFIGCAAGCNSVGLLPELSLGGWPEQPLPILSCDAQNSWFRRPPNFYWEPWVRGVDRDR